MLVLLWRWLRLVIMVMVVVAAVGNVSGATDLPWVVVECEPWNELAVVEIKSHQLVMPYAR